MKKKKPTILILTEHYLPGYKGGGPIRSISNIVSNLGEHFSFKIITRDRDMADQSKYSGIEQNKWVKINGASVFYVSPMQLTPLGMLRIIKRTHFDAIYINSFFSFLFSIVPVLAIKAKVLHKSPLILAPRGEFSEGALGIKKNKKTLYIKLAKAARIYNNICWQATSINEKNDIRKVLGDTAKIIKIVPNLTPSPLAISDLVDKLPSHKDKKLKIIFLSRISRKKNLDYAIRILKKVVSNVEFNIFGVKEDLMYLNECKNLARGAPNNVSINFMGGLSHHKVSKKMGEHDLFFFPTRGENFGHVIFEALAAGTPVLISDQTPWKDIEEKGAGWQFPLNRTDLFISAIELNSKMTSYQRKKQRESTLLYALDFFENNSSTTKTKNMLIDSLKKRETH